MAGENTEDVKVFNPYGDKETIPASSIPDALKIGYKIATSEDIHNDALQKKYGTGVLNPLTAAAESAASFATLGGSRVLENATGITTPEAQAARQKYNPISSNVVGPALGLGGALATSALAPEAYALSPIGAAEGLGGAAAEATAPAIGGAASLISNPTAQAILAGAGKEAVRGSVIGGALGLGQSVDEYALGDPHLNGEKIFSNIGMGVLGGAATGGLFGAGETAIPASFEKAQQALGKVYEKAKEIMGEGYIKSSAFASGKPEGVIRDILENRELSLTTPEAQKDVIKTTAEDLQKQYDTTNRFTYDVSNKIRPEETEAILKEMPLEPAIKKMNEVDSAINDKIATFAEKPAFYPKKFTNILKQLQEDVTKVSEKTDATPADYYSSLNKLKKELDPYSKFDMSVGITEKRAVSELRDLRSFIKESLEDESAWGEAGARQAQWNEALTEHLQNKKMFQKILMKKIGPDKYSIDPSKVNSFFRDVGNLKGDEKTRILRDYMDSSQGAIEQGKKSYQALPNKNFDPSNLESVLSKNSQLVKQASRQSEYNKGLNFLGAGGHNAYLGEGAALATSFFHPVIGGTLEAFNMVRNPGLAIPRLARMERLLNRISESIESSAKVLFKAGYPVAKKIAPMTVKIPKSIENDDHNKTDDLHAQINDLNDNPEKLVDTLTKATSGVADVAPNIGKGFQISAVRAIQFLKTKIPPEPMPTALGMKPKHSHAEIAEFNSYLNLIQNPVSIFGHVKDGSITDGQMEAMQAVFPSLLNEMQKSVFDKLAGYKKKKDKESLPYGTVLGLSVFLNTDLDGNLEPQDIVTFQQSQAGHGQEQQRVAMQNQIKVSQKGLDHLGQSRAMLTSSQKSTQRVDS